MVTDASVVDQDVYRPETLRYRLEHPVHLGGIGNVEVHGDSVAARSLDLLGDRLGALAATGGQGDTGSGLHERLRESFPETRVAAGDDGRLARKVKGVQKGQ